jgi:hypothetical protein
LGFPILRHALKTIGKFMDGITMHSLDKGEKIGYSGTKRGCV